MIIYGFKNCSNFTIPKRKKKHWRETFLLLWLFSYFYLIQFSSSICKCGFIRLWEQSSSYQIKIPSSSPCFHLWTIWGKVINLWTIAEQLFLCSLWQCGALNSMFSLVLGTTNWPMLPEFFHYYCSPFVVLACGWFH